MEIINDQPVIQIILEEEEKGKKVGCNPSPWMPCTDGKQNYSIEYTIKRKLYGPLDTIAKTEKDPK